MQKESHPTPLPAWRRMEISFEPPLLMPRLRVMTAPVFRYTHRVTYTECTIGNHVYHARYLDILEAARGGFFRHLGLTFLHWQEQGTLFPVIGCRMQYKTPARYDDVLTIEIQPVIAGRTRLNFVYRAANQAGRLVIEAETHHVCTGLNDRPKRLPEELMAKLSPYLSPEARTI
jgi:acyl-CoA thioester hydrolase